MVLHSVTRCYIVLYGASRCYTALRSLTRCDSVKGCSTVLHSLPGCFTVLYSVTGCKRVLRGAARCYRVLHGINGWYMVLHTKPQRYIYSHHWDRSYFFKIVQQRFKNRYNLQKTCNCHLITNKKINTLCINVPKMAVSLQSGKLSTRDWRADRANLQTAHKAKALRGCRITQPGLALFAGLAWFAEVTFIPALH